MATTRDKYQLEVETRGAQNQLNKLATAMKAFAGVIAIREVIQFGRLIIDTTSQLQTYANQLRLVTYGTEDLNRVTNLLRETAIRNRTGFGETVELFVKLRVATEALGKTEEEVINVTTKLSQALQIAGADATTTASVIKQFGQAMASGEVRGDEFRSLVEGLGPALAIMARESGITVGELRRMSREGELTAETMFKLLESSNALTAAFDTMLPTIAQLETRFGDAFDAALVKLGEVSGLTSAYETQVKDLTRALENFAGVNKLANMNAQELYEGVEKGTVPAQEAIQELISRYRDLDNTIRVFGLNFDTDFGIEDLIGYNEEAKKVITETVNKLYELEKVKKKQAQADKELLDSSRKQQEEINRLLAPFNEYLKLADKYIESDFRTELEKVNDRIAKAKEVIDKLNEAYTVTNGKVANFEKRMQGANAELVNAQKELKKLQEEVKLEGYAKFLDEIMTKSKELAERNEFITRAITEITTKFKEGAISADVYRESMALLGEEIDATNENYYKIIDSVKEFNQQLVDDTEDMRLELEKLNMNSLEQQIADINTKISRDMRNAIAEVQRLMTEADADDVAAAVEEIKKNAEIVRQEQIKLAKAIYETQRTFEYGWKGAFDSYVDEATNAAKQAERIFEKATSSMEDALVNFAKTGKFQFRDLVADILETILRSQIQQLIANVFSLGGSSGGGNVFGKIFGGFFANGGTLGAGKFGIAGENGAELVTGPATITPLSQLGGSNVTYNINAVDASSFKQMVARDPQFIHAVATQGARSVPGRR